MRPLSRIGAYWITLSLGVRRSVSSGYKHTPVTGAATMSYGIEPSLIASSALEPNRSRIEKWRARCQGPLLEKFRVTLLSHGMPSRRLRYWSRSNVGTSFTSIEREGKKTCRCRWLQTPAGMAGEVFLSKTSMYGAVTFQAFNDAPPAKGPRSFLST